MSYPPRRSCSTWGPRLRGGSLPLREEVGRREAPPLSRLWRSLRLYSPPCPPRAAILRGAVLHPSEQSAALPAAPARPRPAPRAGWRSSCRQALGLLPPALALSVRRAPGGASTMVGTVTSQGGALGERGRLGAGRGSLWGLCSSGLGLGTRTFTSILSSCASSSLRRDLEANRIFISPHEKKRIKRQRESAGTAEGTARPQGPFP